jgi:hypothetical protein
MIGGSSDPPADDPESDIGSDEASQQSNVEDFAGWCASDVATTDSGEGGEAGEPPESGAGLDGGVPPHAAEFVVVALPPPPAPHPIGRGRGAGGRGRGRHGGRGVGPAHPTYHIDYRGDGLCVLKYDASNHTISAHCNWPGHGKLCRVRRKVGAGSKPMGFLIAWLACAGDFGGMESH